MEPILIDKALVDSQYYLPGDQKKILHRSVGRYVGAEWTERGWVLNLQQITDSPATWQQRFGENR